MLKNKKIYSTYKVHPLDSHIFEPKLLVDSHVTHGMKAFGDDWLSVLGNKSDTGSLGLYGNIICFLVAMVTIEIT